MSPGESTSAFAEKPVTTGPVRCTYKVWRHLWIVVRPPVPHHVALDAFLQMWSNKRPTRQTDSSGPVRRVIETTEAPRAVEKTLLTPGLRGQVRALALERGATVRHDSRPRCRCKVGDTARMRTTARLHPLTRREANPPCSEW
jgi:hypothetical protein